MFKYAIDGEVHESFILFRDVERTDAATLFHCLTTTLDSLGLSLNQLRGQCYDGASNMRGRYNGVETRVLNVNPKAVYVHCVNHCLNLVLVDTCKSSSECRNFFGLVERLYSFIEASPRRHTIFQCCQRERGNNKPSALKKLIETRLACRCDALRIVKKTLLPSLIPFKK